MKYERKCKRINANSGGEPPTPVCKLDRETQRNGEQSNGNIGDDLLLLLLMLLLLMFLLLVWRFGLL
jgi:hypothetical protein